MKAQCYTCGERVVLIILLSPRGDYMYLFFGPMDMQKSEKAHPGDLGYPFFRSNLQGFVRSSCELVDSSVAYNVVVVIKEANVVLYSKTQWQHI